MSTVSMGVLADWTPRLASIKADLESFLHDAEPLLAARRSAVTQLGASYATLPASGVDKDEPLDFLERLLDIEQLARDVHRMLNIW
jgi:hypothetical protein